ncbi:hypothetical protein [Flavobacterium sp. MK4S-17]|uniref:hypothetical protein n=1 Tax=Flavobacterium sp. MK4S-17 TaxID=2543737 RepID=UPI00135A08AB|nr:hypothetical protein [Flavobacterium sp. MK4S-17]
MGSEADKFIKNRLSRTAMIDSRIKKLLAYIIDCYNKTVEDGKQYDYSKRGKISQENFLRNGLVNDYLRCNLNSLNSGTEYYTVINKESNETYTSAIDGLTHDDPIDIHIVDKALQASWNTDKQIYYALECKRISQLSDSASYIGDIKKSTERDYKGMRLPYEGQIAFIENSKLTHIKIAEDINKKLSTHTSIITNKPLEAVQISNSFNGSYISVHNKIFGDNANFTIHHLLFDYSAIVIQ